jgi:hypothetical protein
VVKELRDADRLQVRQKLQGGKLQIFVEEIDSPGVSLLTRWAAAALCPRQLARLGPEAEALRQAVERQFMVLPRRDILLGGSAQDERQLAGARIVRNFLDRLEKIPAVGASPAQSPKSTMPVWIGIAFEAGKPGAPWELPIERIIHTYVSGSTGSGKSFLSRAIVEGCACLEDLSIVVLDPGNQWIGLRCPEDRPEILAR